MDRAAALDRLESGYGAVMDSLVGITPAELDREPPGEWSPRMIVHHLADAEAVAHVRLLRLIAEDMPPIAPFDVDGAARVLHYDRPIDSSLAVLKAVRESSLSLLRSLGTVEWERVGKRADGSDYGVDDWLRIYSEHAHEHADQIERARNGEP